MPREPRRQVRRRARKIRKASRKPTTKDYIQYGIVILVILGILVMAFWLTKD